MLNNAIKIAAALSAYAFSVADAAKKASSTQSEAQPQHSFALGAVLVFVGMAVTGLVIAGFTQGLKNSEELMAEEGQRNMQKRLASSAPQSKLFHHCPTEKSPSRDSLPPASIAFRK
jgi:hypothetical protein